MKILVIALSTLLSLTSFAQNYSGFDLSVFEGRWLSKECDKSDIRILEINIQKTPQGLKIFNVEDGVSTQVLQSFAGSFQVQRASGLVEIQNMPHVIRNTDLSSPILMIMTNEKTIDPLSLAANGKPDPQGNHWREQSWSGHAKLQISSDGTMSYQAYRTAANAFFEQEPYRLIHPPFLNYFWTSCRFIRD